MKSLTFLLVVGLLLLALVSCAETSSFTLSKAGKAHAAIVVDSSATLSEQTTAKELSAYLKQITGADFPVFTSGSEPSGLSKIYVGQSDTTKRLLGNIDWKSLKSDGIVIKFIGRDLVLAGDRPRGTLYAVYTFLEDYCGCRWWTPDSSFVPSKPALIVKALDKRYVPPFLYRETFYKSVLYTNSEFSVKLKLNGHNQPIPDSLGAHYQILGFCHTMPWLLPASAYFKDHPEWFAVVNGKRSPDNTQPCLTNMEMKDEMVRQALKWIEKDSWAGIISISQTDGGIPCQCEKCQAVVKEEGSESGPLIRFVNAVAEDIETKYPDFLVETLAYTFSRQAPKLVKPRQNVIIRLCSIEGDFAKPLNSKTNAAFYKDLQDWSRITDRLFVWDYVVNFWNGLIAHPNWRVLGPNLRLFQQNKVIGMFEQGDGFNKDATFGHMKTWVLAKLMWDPSLDSHKLMAEFANGYYGKSGTYMMKYLDATCDVIERHNVFLSSFNRGSLNHFSQADMDYFTDCFDKAENAVMNNAKQLERVQTERRTLDHMWILQPLYDRSKAVKFHNTNMKALVEDFISQSVATGNDYVVEGERMTPAYIVSLRSLAVMPAMPRGRTNITPPAKTAGLNSKQWFDYQEDKMGFSRPGIWVFGESDTEASDGRALRMNADHKEWAIQLATKDLKEVKTGKYSIWVSVKVKHSARSGTAVLLGVIDTRTTVQVNRQEIPMSDLKSDAYVEYCLGTYEKNPNLVAFVAPAGNPDAVDEVLVDRFFIVKEK